MDHTKFFSMAELGLLRFALDLSAATTLFSSYVAVLLCAQIFI